MPRIRPITLLPWEIRNLLAANDATDLGYIQIYRSVEPAQSFFVKDGIPYNCATEEEIPFHLGKAGDEFWVQEQFCILDGVVFYAIDRSYRPLNEAKWQARTADNTGLP